MGIAEPTESPRSYAIPSAGVPGRFESVDECRNLMPCFADDDGLAILDRLCRQIHV